MILSCPKRTDGKPHWTYENRDYYLDGNAVKWHTTHPCIYCGYVVNESMYDRKQVSADQGDDAE